MLGIQLDQELFALTVTRALLERGYLVLPAGARGDVIQLVPPATIEEAQLEGFVDAFQETLRSI